VDRRQKLLCGIIVSFHPSSSASLMYNWGMPHGKSVEQQHIVGQDQSLTLRRRKKNRVLGVRVFRGERRVRGHGRGRGRDHRPHVSARLD
jgi:hypothetical protein